MKSDWQRKRAEIADKLKRKFGVDFEDIGAELRAMRTAAGVSRREAASLVGLGEATVERAERGVASLPSVAKLADFFDLGLPAQMKAARRVSLAKRIASLEARVSLMERLLVMSGGGKEG